MDTPAHPDPARDELVARVVAWHNRRAFTSRIDAGHVTGTGVVALPFAEATPPARWLPRPLRWTRKLSTPPLVEPLSAAQVAAFAWRHGADARPGPAGWPLRLVVLDAAADDAVVRWRHVRTAAIELGQRRIRVLVGAEGAEAAVIGARYWSRPRLSRLLGAIAGCVLLSGAAAAAGWLLVAPDDATTETASVTPAAAGASTDAMIPTPLPAALEAASAPNEAPGEPEPGDRQGESANAPDLAGTIAEAAATGAAASGPPHETAETAPRQASDPAIVQFALATKPTRSRGAALLRAAFINAPDQPRAGRAHLELMHTDAGWRAVLWPFPTREAAERVRETLATRGVRVELIDF